MNAIQTIDKNFFLYDNMGKTFDRVTAVFKNSKSLPLYGGRYYDYECIGSSENGTGFFQHSNCQRGSHLGKKITAKDLTKDLQKKLVNYLEN